MILAYIVYGNTNNFLSGRRYFIEVATMLLKRKQQLSVLIEFLFM